MFFLNFIRFQDQVLLKIILLGTLPTTLTLHTKPSSTSFTYDNYAILYDSPHRFLSGGLHFG
jgi:hypothetical protein